MIRLQVITSVLFFATLGATVPARAWASPAPQSVGHPTMDQAAAQPASQAITSPASPVAAPACTKGLLWPFVRNSGDCPTTFEKQMPGWITTTNQPCRIWNPVPQPNESVTWSGACENGLASGVGNLKWTENGKPDAEYDGEYKNGKRNGHGVMTILGGQRIEGVWVDDKLVAKGGGANL
jgi:MORN repeat protein